MRTLRLGTRGSLLARTQSGHVATALHKATDWPVELVIIKTTGDRVTDRPLLEVGGKGLFTKELEDALLNGAIDFAVHSMKDMPTEMPAGLVIAAVPERVNPLDGLVGCALADLQPGAIVGTGSVRRALQLRALRPDLEIRGIRGNVGTRVQKQRDGGYDVVVLAMAGLTRLGKADVVSETLTVAKMVPACGQGALAIQAREDDPEILPLLEALHHEPTAICVAAERAFLEAVSGGCSAPAACHAWLDGDWIVAEAVWAPAEHSPARRLRSRSDFLHATPLGRDLAHRLQAGEGEPLLPLQ